jgi:hypothetical protein
VKSLFRRAPKALAASLLTAFGVYSCNAGPEARVDVAPSPPPSTSDFNVGDSDLVDEQATPEQQCQQESRQAVSLGLDIYLMLDSSLSMEELLPAQATGRDQTKWEAVQAALRSFIAAPQTAEIGVGLQYFPQVAPGVPFTCNSNDDCGATGGACSNSLCVQSSTGQLPDGNSVSLLSAASDSPCLEDDDCSGSQRCRSLLGQCVYAPGDLDFPDGSLLPAGKPALCGGPADCADLPGSVCEEVGVCERQINSQNVACTRSFGCPGGAGACSRPGHVCSEQKLCSVGEYGTPAVPIRRDAARVDEVLESLAGRERAGPTPTGPALQGALQHAKTWAAAHTDRQVITVVVTDGFPTDCSPLGIPEIAAIAQEANVGAQPVHTFFVGVFSDTDLGFDGVERLDTLARAGGSERAVVINTANDVAQEFLDALDAIRDSSALCNFQLDEAGLDLERVNLDMVDTAGVTTQLVNVGNVSACGTDQQGWFYETDANGVRRQITVCPSTCRQFVTGTVRANLQIGCATRIR